MPFTKKRRGDMEMDEDVWDPLIDEEEEETEY
jgi:hypothetical protein